MADSRMRQNGARTALSARCWGNTKFRADKAVRAPFCRILESAMPSGILPSLPCSTILLGSVGLVPHLCWVAGEPVVPFAEPEGPIVGHAAARGRFEEFPELPSCLT